MNWLTKAALFQIFDNVPFGYHAYQATVHFVTRSVPTPDPDLDRFYLDRIEEVAETFRELGALLPTARYLEFGAGYNLVYPIGLWCCGIEDLVLIDLYPLVSRRLVNHAIDALARRPPRNASRAPAGLLGPSFKRDLKNRYGIDYRAPFDARKTTEPDHSIDLVATTSTLEHVPPDELGAIYRELLRICKPTAILAMRIDYRDHYSHGNPSVSPYNFLKFSPKKWKIFNPSIHYQNRLRHHQHREIIARSGFDIVQERTERPDDWRLQLGRQRLDEEFAAMDPEQVSITSGYFVFRPAARAASP